MPDSNAVNLLQITRGTTPTIEARIVQDIDLHSVAALWITITQLEGVNDKKEVKIFKQLSDVTFDYDLRTISVKLSQEDTLKLNEGGGTYQIRMLTIDETALITPQCEVVVSGCDKEGIITPTGE